MIDLHPVAKLSSALVLALLCACSMSPHPSSLSEPSAQDFSEYSEWVSTGYRCEWGPSSSGFPAETLIDQYGACGPTRTMTVVPRQFDQVTGLVRTQGTPYQVTQMDTPSPSSRRIYADYFKKITPVLTPLATPHGNAFYLGIVPGRQTSLDVMGGGKLSVYLLANTKNSIGVISLGNLPSFHAQRWISRYAFVDFTDHEGAALATFGIDSTGRFSKALGRDKARIAAPDISMGAGASAYLAVTPGGPRIQDFFSKWKTSPRMVEGLRLHN